MNKRSRWGVLLLLLVLVSTTGCGKFMANRAIKGATAAQTDATNAQANVYVSQQFEEASNELARAQTQFDNKQWEEAVNSARAAKETFEAAIAAVEQSKVRIEQKKKELQDLLAQAESKLQQAMENGVQNIDPGAYNTAQTAIEDARTKVQAQLSATPQRPQDYDNVMQQVQGALDSAQIAYDLTLEQQAEDVHADFTPLRNELQEILSQYQPAGAEDLNNALAGYMAAYEQREYERALDLYDQIKAQFQEVLTEGRRLRAEDYIARAEQTLADADVQLEASENIPEVYGQAESSLEDARDLLNAGEFANAYEEARSALTTAETIRDEMRRRTEEMIQIGLYGNSPSLKQQAIDVGAEEYTPELLERGERLLQEAEALLAEDRLREAYESAQDGYNALQDAYNRTRELKAEEALARANAVMERAEEEGAADYTPGAYGKAQASMREARNAFQAGQYELVLTEAQEAERDANQVIEALGEQAQADIDAAQSAQTSAREAQAERYEADLMTEAQRALANAENALGQEQFGQAISSARFATQRFQTAETETYRKRTEETRQLAEEEQSLAAAAGAKEHTPQVFLDGLDYLQTSQGLYQERRFKDALAEAQQALESFRSARFRKIEDANQAIVSAQEALADEYAAEPLQEALSLLADSRIAMNEARYEASNQLAEQAQAVAQEAERQTWQLRAEEQIQTNQQRMERLAANLAPEKVKETYTAAVTYQAEARTIYQDEAYRDSYEKAVEARETLDEAESNLAGLAQQDLDELRERAKGIVGLSTDDFTAQQVQLIYESINAASAALGEDQYKQAFTTITAGRQTAAQVENVVKENIVVQGIADIRQSIANYRETGVALFVENRIAQIQNELAELEQQKAVMTYEEATAELSDLRSRVANLEQQARTVIVSGLNDAQRLLDEARRAQALTFIRNEYFEATDYYKKAEAYRETLEEPVYGNFRDMHELYSAAVVSASDVHQRTNRIRDERAYKDLIFYDESSYMNDMASLLNDFAPVTDFTPEFYRAAKSSPDVDIYGQLQNRITAEELNNRADYLYESVENFVPPPTMRGVHNRVVGSFRELVIASELFVRYGEYGKYEPELRQEFIVEAFEHLEKVRLLNQEVERMLLAMEREERGDDVRPKGWWEKFWDQVKEAFGGKARYEHVSVRG